ncbi:MAG: hypothetical protein U1E42_01965 [Rhodospirillales bacterium]
MRHLPYDEASTESDETPSPALPFEAEFDGVRRTAARPEPILDPSRYWDMHGGTD